MQRGFAFDSFSQWCIASQKTSTIKRFDKEELKLTPHLDLHGHRFMFKKYSRGLGKVSDAGLFAMWLDVTVAQLDPSLVPVAWYVVMRHIEP